MRSVRLLLHVRHGTNGQPLEELLSAELILIAATILM